MVYKWPLLKRHRLLAGAIGAKVSRTVDKALRILELLGYGELRLVDISSRLGEHKSTVQRLLATLLARGFVRQDETSKRYSLGLKVLELASVTLADMDLREVAREPMQRVGEHTGETVHLGVYDEPHVVYIDKIESTFPVRMYSRVGARAESYCTGVGKALVAFLGDYEFEHYLRKVSFTRFTPKTITSARGLREEIARIRAHGYALDLEEHEEGVRCAAAPVFGLDGRVAGSISVAAPAFRKSEDDIRALAPAVMGAARQISENLGNNKEGGRREELA
jgi:IclR family transcriptional regulator, KDG regulon repressor